VRPAPEIIEMMRAVAPPGQRCLDPAVAGMLRGLTYGLAEARPDAAAEYARFLGITRRGLPLPEDALLDHIGDADILVTGGTGCIGQKLLEHLTARRSGLGCLASVSRGRTGVSADRVPDVRYLHADVRDRMAMDKLMRDRRPDIVFHIAAQRDPGLAESQVHRTVSTNVIGTFNVLAAAANAGVPQVVLASTGKALRPYSPDIYTASKRAAEWISAQIANETSMLVSASRFTHVLDNSIIYRRLQQWVLDGEPIRLHSPDISFYVQSARESAHLLLLAALGAQQGEYRINAITDLGWPVSLLDVTLAMLAQERSPAPVYFSGYDAGYEEVAFPGLYDPLTAGEVSPLINAFEAAALTSSPSPRVDTFAMAAEHSSPAVKALIELNWECEQTRDPDVIRAALDEMSWAVLDAALHEVPRETLLRSARTAQRHDGSLCDVHRRVLEAILAAAGPA
jgi:nucleoside-diphosphate-sugar epimerase